MLTDPFLLFEVIEHFSHNEPERRQALQRIIDRYLVTRLTADEPPRRDEECSAPSTPD